MVKRGSPSGVVRLPQQALVDQRRHAVKHIEDGHRPRRRRPRAADRLGRLQRAAAHEDGQPAEQRLLGRRPAGRSSRRWRRAGSAGARAGRARRRSAAAARRSRRASSASRREHLMPRRRQLDRQRQPVQPRGRSRPRPARSRRSARSPARTAGARSHEQAHGRRTASQASGRRRAARSGSASGGTAYSCSPRRCSAARLVTSTSAAGGRQQLGDEPARPRAPARSCPAPAAAAGRAGSSLGSRRSGRPPASRTPSAWAMVGTTRAGSRIGARSTRRARRPAKCAEQSAATWSARRVLPMPPGPVSVSSRTSSRSSRIWSLGKLALAPDQRRRLGRQVVHADVDRGERRSLIQ